jgi:hypothetical protein
VGSAFFGYGLVTIFTTTFLYTVFVYGVHSASALAFMTCIRYIIAGALVPASIPMYQNLGPHKALTIPAVLATVMAPVPFLLYKYGAKIRVRARMPCVEVDGWQEPGGLKSATLLSCKALCLRPGTAGVCR